MLRALTGRTTPLALLFAVVLLVPGCQTLRVSTDHGSVAGLPFYLKSGVFRHHTLYEQPFIHVSVAVAAIIGVKNGEDVLAPETTYERDVMANQENLRQIDALQSMITDITLGSATDVQKSLPKLRDALDAIPRMSRDTLLKPDMTALPNANFVERVTVTDYNTRYYLNSNRSAFGSATVSAELAADGTLSKSEAQSESKVPDAITAAATALTGIAPIKEFLTYKWIPAAAPGASGAAATSDTLAKTLTTLGVAVGPEPPMGARIQLRATESAMVYDMYLDSANDPSATGLLIPLKRDPTMYQFVIKQKEQPEEKKPDDAISFKGSIQLPAPKKP